MKKYLRFIFMAGFLSLLMVFMVQYRMIGTRQDYIIAILNPVLEFHIELEKYAEDDKQDDVLCEEADDCIETPVFEVNENNPYARWRETFSGYYLYDIYEANKGSLADEDWFIKESERFVYHEQYDPDPLNHESLTFDWKIELSEMKGTDPLSDSFNSYHQKLFEEQKTLMQEHQNEAMGIGMEDLKEHWMNIRFSMSISTLASFQWGNIFTVVDMKNAQDRGCWPVIANFNSLSGEQYELEDLFCVKNYEEELYKIVREEKNVSGKFSEKLSFMMGDQGLLLMDPAWSPTRELPLITWGKLEDIMTPEIWEVLNISSIQEQTQNEW